MSVGNVGTSWLAAAQGIDPLGDDGMRIERHWSLDAQILAAALADFDQSSARPFFDVAMADFDAMVHGGTAPDA